MKNVADDPTEDFPRLAGAPVASSDDPTEELRAAPSGAAPADDDDPRLLAAVREYMAALEAGRHPSRQEMLARHPDIADELAACLDGLAFIHSAAGRMVGPSAAPQPGDGGGHASLQVGTDADGDDATARPLGDFRLIREIGRGGMGVVYEAVQLSLGRRVAVKVLPFAATLDARHLQRFRNEAQAAAQLHHTNIVPVYAVGCERSVHYYAMQLIEGQSLADVIRDLRSAADRARDKHAKDRTPKDQPADTGPAATDRDAGGRDAAPAETDMTIALLAGRTGIGSRPGPNRQPASGSGTGTGGLQLRRSTPAAPLTAPAQDLSLMRAGKRSTFFQAVARLGLQAAEALDYAHEQGVVHRDVKPENLLLDTRGNLWVTDFGLAQFYAESAENGLTQTGDLLGTLRYMSPEQASGRAVVLDQRTDVYSLGLTLYELLTLERAMPAKTREQLLWQIDAHEPRSPRSIDRAIPPEMETILFKAIAKEPADRYPTARAMADDLRRFLNDEPILARPPSLWDKGVKWTRRHKPLAASALAMLVLAAVGLLISTLLIAREQGKTRAAYEGERQKAIEADRQWARAEKNAQQARQAVDFFARIAAEEMGRPEFNDVRKEMLEASLAYYQSFLDDHRGEDAAASADLREARSHVSAILSELTAFDEVFRVQFRARLLSERSVRDELGLSPEQVARAERLPGVPGRGMGGGGPAGRGGGVPGGPGGLGDLRQLTPEQKRDRLAGTAGALESELGDILTVEQAGRLRQIARQVRGPVAFSDPDVAAALALTKQQKDKIRTIQAESRDVGRRRGPPGQPGGGPDRPSDRPKDDAVRDVLALLTPSQVETWNALAGRPFTGPVFTFDRPFDRPPQRRP